MIEKTQIKIDDSGRIVIPKLIRKKFSLEKNEYLILESDNEKIIIKKKQIEKEYQDIIDKLNYLNKKYKLSFIMMNNNEIIYTTENYKKLLNKKIYKNLNITNELKKGQKTKISKLDFIEKNHYYFSIRINQNTKGTLFIITEEKNKDIVELIYNLLK